MELFEGDTLHLAFLRKQRRDSGEARPEPFYAWKWWESGGVFRRLTDK